MDIIEFAKTTKDVLRPFGDIEVLLYYAAVSKKLAKYLEGKEIASKNWLGKKGFLPTLIKRGSKLEPLYINEFSEITHDFLKIRKEIKSLKDASGKINKAQAKLWEYFLPRKLSDFFYATNNEGVKKDIERIFFDVDSNINKDDTRKATKEFVELIKKDKKFIQKYRGELFVMWTGASFHVNVFLDRKIKNQIYEQEIAFKKDNPLESFIGRWAAKLNKKFKFKVAGGHEKIKKGINIDPSQTPSGKLCRAPFSLHMKNEKTVDGIAIPLDINDLNDKKLINRLKSYTPMKVIEEIDRLGDKLPNRFR